MTYDNTTVPATEDMSPRIAANTKGGSVEFPDVMAEHDRLEDILAETINRLNERLIPYLRPNQPTVSRELTELDTASPATQRLHLSCQRITYQIDRLNDIISLVG